MRNKRKIKNILILIISGIGDTLSMLPFFYALRGKFFEAQITIVSQKNILDLVANEKYFDNTINIDYIENVLNDEVESVRFFRKFDLILHDTHSENINKNIQKSRVFNFCFNMAANIKRSVRSPIEFIFKIAKLLRIGNIPSVAKIFLTETDKVFAKSYFKKNKIDMKNDFIVIIQAGSGMKKRWFFDRYVVIARWLIDKYNAKILAISGPVDSFAGEALKEKLHSRSVVVVKNLSLRQLAVVLNKTSFYLGNDGGIMHLSAAVGIPTIVIFGPSNASYWAPRGPFHIQLSDNISSGKCSKTRLARCGFQKCFDNIKTKEVKNAVKCLLNNMNTYKYSKYVTIMPDVRIKKIDKDALLLYKDVDNLGILYFKRGGKYVENLLRYIENNKLLSDIKKRFPEDEDLLKLLMEKGVIRLLSKTISKNIVKIGKIHHELSNKVGGIILPSPNYEAYSFLRDTKEIEYPDIKNDKDYLTPCIARDTYCVCPRNYT